MRQSISIQRTVHFQTHGQLSKKTKYIWICLHGYGQTSEYLHKKFQFLDPEMHFVICPEGFNRFYWHEGNKPVACWMTKRDRYDEINDNVAYLNALYNRYCRHVNQQTEIILFGFSQGCATLWRWIHAVKPRFKMLINWGGWIPEDISYLHMSGYLSDKDIRMYYGKSDRFFNEEMNAQIQKVIKDNRLVVNISNFEGKHNIPQQVLQDYVEQNVLINDASTSGG